jgi:hypothetical protein
LLIHSVGGAGLSVLPGRSLTKKKDMNEILKNVDCEALADDIETIAIAGFEWLAEHGDEINAKLQEWTRCLARGIGGLTRALREVQSAKENRAV